MVIQSARNKRCFVNVSIRREGKKILIKSNARDERKVKLFDLDGWSNGGSALAEQTMGCLPSNDDEMANWQTRFPPKNGSMKLLTIRIAAANPLRNDRSAFYGSVLMASAIVRCGLERLDLWVIFAWIQRGVARGRPADLS